MQIKINRFYSAPLVNLFRQMAMTQLDVIRPIGFKVGNSNLLSAGDSVLEDTMEISANLANLVYTEDKSNPVPSYTVIPVHVNVNGTLYARELENSGIRVNSGDAEILHTLDTFPSDNSDGSEGVVVYFFKGKGSLVADDCVKVLQSANCYDENTIIMNARFNKIESFTFSEIDDNEDDMITLDINIDTVDGTSTVEIINFCKEELQKVISSF